MTDFARKASEERRGQTAPTSDRLATRVMREYREMPGLSLTLRQACRLWEIEPALCENVLQSLVTEGLLLRTRHGAFVAVPGAVRRAPLKANLDGARRDPWRNQA